MSDAQTAEKTATTPFWRFSLKYYGQSGVSDACIALPGGIGTVEEMMEAWTLNQLGDVDKPVGLLDVDGFWQPFLGFIDRMVERAFLPAAHRGSIAVSADPAALIDALAAAPPITVPKWM